jgi:hypothetical protein
MSVDTVVTQVEQNGFVVLPGVFTAAQVDALLESLTPALQAPPNGHGTMRSETGSIYAARNLLTLWPPVAQVWRQPPLLEALAAVLGPGYGLVRVLYFDKPPERSWALPWHKDLTIAVRRHLLSAHFSKPTRKAGVPHVEAPTELLEAMLTARIHLDEVTEENGPLKVLPGSHRTGKAMVVGEAQPRAILAGRGDVLLMRPLLAHNSGNSHPETKRHRRILHLEFAGRRELSDGYAWHDYLPA